MAISPRIRSRGSVVRLVRAAGVQRDQEDRQKPRNHPSLGPGCRYKPHSRLKAAAETQEALDVESSHRLGELGCSIWPRRWLRWVYRHWHFNINQFF